VSVPFVFALAYFFTDQIGAILADVHRVERCLALAALIALTGGVAVYVVRSNRRVLEGSLAQIMREHMRHPHPDPLPRRGRGSRFDPLAPRGRGTG
jgi:hypothetical protein